VNERKTDAPVRTGRPFVLRCRCGAGADGISWTFESEALAILAADMHVILGPGHTCRVTDRSGSQVGPDINHIARAADV
jgi:hypothetical protein